MAIEWMLRHPSLARRRGRGACRPRRAHPAAMRRRSACRGSRVVEGDGAGGARRARRRRTRSSSAAAAPIRACSTRRVALLRPGGRLVANAVTLEMQALLADAAGRLGGDLTTIAVARAGAGRRHDRLAPGDAGDAVGLGEAVTVAGHRLPARGVGRGGAGGGRGGARRAARSTRWRPCRRSAASRRWPRRRGGSGCRSSSGRWPTATRGSLSRSAASRAATGSGSASEAAALAAAGPAARLVGPRLALGPVTCAIAVAEGARMTVHFIGAGPGAADLITVRGRDLLARCPVCLYAGSVVPPELLAHCPPGARLRRHRADVARRDRGRVRRRARRRARRGAAALRRPLDLERGRRAGAAAGAPRHPLHADPGRAGLRRGGGGARARADHPRGGAEPRADPRLGPRLGDARRARRWRPSARTGATLAIHLAVHALPRVVAELAPLYGADCPVAVVARASWPGGAGGAGDARHHRGGARRRPDRPDRDHPRRARASPPRASATARSTTPATSGASAGGPGRERLGDAAVARLAPDAAGVRARATSGWPAPGRAASAA